MEEVYTCKCGCQYWIIIGNTIKVKCKNCKVEYTMDKWYDASYFNNNISKCYTEVK